MSFRRWTLFLSIALFAGPLRAIPLTGTVEPLDGAVPAGVEIELVPMVGNYSRARLFLEGRSSPAPVTVTAADGAGRFALEAPASGLYTVIVRAAGFVPLESLPLAVTEARELAPAVLAADAGSRVEVRDTGGTPIAGAYAVARPTTAAAGGFWAPARRFGRTGDDGTARLPRAAAERLDVTCWVPRRGRLEQALGVTRTAALTVAEAVTTAAIEVVGDDGAPLAGVVVALGEPALPVGVTDEHGRLSAALPQGVPLTLLAADGRLLKPRPASLPLRVSFPTRGIAGGRVVSAADRRPIPGALVWPSADPGSFLVSDAEGRFTVPRGAVWAVAAGFLPASGGAGSDVVLVPGGRVFGRVIDRGERPVAGARVELRPTAAPPGTAPVDAVTGADGRFAAGLLPAGRLDAVARHPGYAPTVVRGIPGAAGSGAAADLGTLILEPGAAITGRVRDGAGRAVAGVAVWLSADLHRAAADLLGVEPTADPAALTDGAGRFVAADLVPGDRFHLLFRADGYRPAVLDAVTAPAPNALEVVLEPGAAVRGRVVDEAGDAVSGAAVILRPAALNGSLELPPLGPEHHHRTLTDAGGAYAFDGVAAGRFEIAAGAAGYLAPPTRPLTVTPDGAAGVDFVLGRGAVLSGRVTTAGDVPLAGVRVTAEDAAAATGEDGTYRLEGVAPGPRTVEARHPTLPRRVAEIDVGDGDNVLDFVFDAGHALSGRVVDEDGAAVAASVLELDLMSGEEPLGLRAESDADGRFRFPEVTGGRYRLRASKPGHAWTELPRPLIVTDRDLAGVEVVLAAGAVLTGRVVGLDGDALAAVDVVAESPDSPPRRGTVDYDGRYEVTDLGPGDWRVTATTADRRRQASARLAVEPGARRLERDLELGGGFTVEGEVRCGGEPLAGAEVSVTGQDVDQKRRVVADYGGAFHIEDLAPGTYRLSAFHPRKLLVSNEEIVLTGDERVVIEIEAAKVHGTVRSANGEPLADVQVLLHQRQADGSGGSLYGAVTDADGYFALPQLTAGRYRLTLRRDGYEPVQDDLELLAGPAGPPLAYELAPAAGLELEVVLASGVRPPDATVIVSGPDGQRLLTDRRNLVDGRVRLPTVPAGTWDVLVSAPGGAAQELELTVPGEPALVVLPAASRLRVRVPALVESDRTASVRLFDAGGRPLRGTAAGGMPAFEWQLVGGVADVGGVPPGVWNVQASVPGGGVWTGTVVTAAEPEASVSLE